MMKKIKIVAGILALVVLVACQGDTKDQTIENIQDEVVETSVISQSVMDKGRTVYMQCLACHQANGEGIVGTFPPLANSDYMLADIDRTIKTIINGTKDPIMVNGTEYPGNTMTKFTHLCDEDIVAVATYVLNSWGNSGGVVTTEMVAANR